MFCPNCGTQNADNAIICVNLSNVFAVFNLV